MRSMKRSLSAPEMSFGWTILAAKGDLAPGMRIPEDTLGPPAVRRHEPGRQTDLRK